MPEKNKSNFEIFEIKIAERFEQISPYVDPKVIGEKEAYLREQANREIIDLSLGSPDSQTPPEILESLKQALQKRENCAYPSFSGKKILKSKIKLWLEKRFNFVDLGKLQLENLLPLMGSKEGLAHFPLAYLNPGDLAIIPDPHYPVHKRGVLIAGAEVYDLVLDSKNNYLPDLQAIPKRVANKAKLLTICYPNNPTGAVIEKAQLKEIVDFCRKYKIFLCHDLAYSEIAFEGHRPSSIFEIMSLEENGIEFFTFSKTYHMAGWRLAFALGNQEMIAHLLRAKTNLDYGVCNAIQEMGASAFDLPQEYYTELKNLYQRRTSLFYQTLLDLNFEVFKPKGGMYVWTKAPQRKTDFCQKLLQKLGIVATPGQIFGKYSSDCLRFALVQDEQKIAEAIKRLKSCDKLLDL